MSRRKSRAGVAEPQARLDFRPLVTEPRQASSAVGADGHRARMRSRLLAAGPDALNDQDLLEMLLFLALPRRDTKPIARALLHRFGTMAAVVSLPAPELRAIDGLGEAASPRLKPCRRPLSVCYVGGCKTRR